MTDTLTVVDLEAINALYRVLGLPDSLSEQQLRLIIDIEQRAVWRWQEYANRGVILSAAEKIDVLVGVAECYKGGAK